MSNAAVRIETPYRQKRSGKFDVAVDPDAVFGLMCPVREYEWEPGWRTNLILSNSGLVEEGCIFTTPAGASEGSGMESGESVWVTPTHDPVSRRVMMIKVTPRECLTRLEISVAPSVKGAVVSVSYEHTALSNAGRRVVDQHTDERYQAMLKRWAAAIEDRLVPGKCA